MRISARIVLACLFLATSISCATGWTYCVTSPRRNIDIKSVDVTPYPIKKGFPTTIRMQGIVTNNIIVDTIGGTVQNYGSNLYTLYANDPYQYPLSVGNTFDYLFQFEYRSYLDKGHYKTLVNIRNPSGSVIECIQLEVDI